MNANSLQGGCKRTIVKNRIVTEYVTCRANPGSVCTKSAYRAGIQICDSVHDYETRALSRIHTTTTAMYAVEIRFSL